MPNNDLIGLVTEVLKGQQTVIAKIDAVGERVGHGETAIGKLEERVAAYMGIAESIQSSMSGEVSDMKKQIHALEKELPIIKLYIRGATGVAVLVVIYLAGQWALQRPPQPNFTQNIMPTTSSIEARP